MRRRPDIEVRPLPKGALLVDLNTGGCFRLNHVGAEVWSALDEAGTCGQLCEKIANRYRLPPDQAAEDVGALLEQLLAGSLAVIVAGEP